MGCLSGVPARTRHDGADGQMFFAEEPFLFCSLREGTGRMAHCPPACKKRLAIEMENPTIGVCEIPNPVIPVDDCLMLRQMMAADRANALLLLQLVRQQELLPTPMKPPAHERDIYRGLLNNMLWPATAGHYAPASVRSGASTRALRAIPPQPRPRACSVRRFGRAFVAWFDCIRFGRTAGNPLVRSLYVICPRLRAFAFSGVIGHA